MKSLIKPHESFERYMPSVSFDAETGNCEISGESFMESPDKFYVPIVAWIQEYIETVNKPITLILKLTYYNTTTSKFLVEIFKLLKDFESKNGVVEIAWYYTADDEDMIEEIAEFSRESGIQIKAIRM